jgi:hypothetical protein
MVFRFIWLLLNSFIILDVNIFDAVLTIQIFDKIQVDINNSVGRVTKMKKHGRYVVKKISLNYDLINKKNNMVMNIR